MNSDAQSYSDANYAEQLEIEARIKRGHAQPEDRERLRYLQAALGGWLKSGGPAPKGYKKAAARKFSGLRLTKKAGAKPHTHPPRPGNPCRVCGR